MEEKFLIKQAEYKTSAVSAKNFLNDLNEIAFVGRSNVGKSSLINSITNRKKLAKTSSTPGLTKMVNYFLINNSFYFVDLPGYGFSKTGKKHQELWSTLIDDYLKFSQNLKLVFLLVDIRHEPSELDITMQKFLFYNNIPYKIIATKCDKVAKSQINNYCTKIAKSLTITAKNIIPYGVADTKSNETLLKIIGEVNG
ncbi:MAG: ribosome biogenesis GTP-binding protein YihA/YsxC [Clostridia bacterium]|nr:ribosome biogenesis GTP-binding protein YihA/YsxC [Clostridia bacterium]